MKAFRSTSTITSQLSSARCTRPALTASHLDLARQSLPIAHKRTFLSNPFAQSVQSLTASRTLPYSSKVLYDIISDVSSYQNFLPFCQKSEVTKLSNPDEDGKQWPEEGKLVVGFNNDISESFYSRIYCVPGQIVEAVSGATETSILSPHKIAHHNPRPQQHSQDPSRNATVLTHLLTRWSLRPFPTKPGAISLHEKPQQSGSPNVEGAQTEVNLAIDYCFANPVYGALSAAAAPKVAEKMIQAFETRVKAVLDGRAK